MEVPWFGGWSFLGGRPGPRRFLDKENSGSLSSSELLSAVDKVRWWARRRRRRRGRFDGDASSSESFSGKLSPAGDAAPRLKIYLINLISGIE